MANEKRPIHVSTLVKIQILFVVYTRTLKTEKNSNGKRYKYDTGYLYGCSMHGQVVPTFKAKYRKETWYFVTRVKIFSVVFKLV